MALYDGEDEETRRQRREENTTPPYNSDQGDGRSWWERSGLDPDGDGFGSPESGYGPGGVDNPAYGGGGGDVPPPAAPPPTAAPQTAAPPPPAQFQPPAPQASPWPSSYTPWTTQQGPQLPSVKTPAITDEVTRVLMDRLKQLQNPGDVASDPLYQQAVRQNQIQQLRNQDRQRKSLAERTAATGGTTRSGGFNVGVAGIQERAGENAAQYRSGLAMDRLQQREAQLVQAIQIARAVGQDDMANQLELQRMAIQKELGDRDLALRGELGRGQLGLGYDQLGFNYANLMQNANRDAVLAALGGA